MYHGVMNAIRAHVGTGYVMVALAGAISALAGGYWDDGWHTERGRDDFFIPPHIAIYAGVTAIGGAVSWWLLTILRQEGTRGVLQHPIPLLGMVSVLVTLASGPIDNAWHEAFGRDAVIWSPPHMLGIVGTLCLGAALLAQISDRRWLAIVTSGLVLAASAFTVVEYETDVPQFDSLWYLPVLCASVAVGFSIIRLARPVPWSCTESAAAQLVFVLLVSIGLWLGDLPTPAVPLLLIAALALDLVVHRGAFVNSLVLTALVYATHVPVRNWLGSGVEIAGDDVVRGVPVAVAACWGVFRLAERRPLPTIQRRRMLPVATLVAVLLVLPVAVAMAHDPGQGVDAGELELTMQAEGRTINVTGEDADGCPDYASGRIVARRAGQRLVAPLQLSACSFSGSIRVTERGRWFVYVELGRSGQRVESWLPVEVGRRDVVRDDRRYAYIPARAGSSTAKFLGGAVLYGFMCALLAATLILLKRRPSDAL